MRKAEITINEKTIIIKELKLKELKRLLNDVAEIKGIMPEIDKAFKADLPSDATNAIGNILGVLIELLGSKMVLVIKGTTTEDIEEAYPSEIEAALKAFVNVNFSGLKAVGAPLLKLMIPALNLKQP